MGNTNAPRKVHKLTKKHRISRKVQINNLKSSGKLRPSEIMIHGKRISKKKQQKIDRRIKFQQKHRMEGAEMIIEKIRTDTTSQMQVDQ
ncbi:uncharacterized protein OCT59_025712 [Rhizophagus irregularis]|uniref:uncharacterized protein n=1 Tax=Rhizophagus irregularis TaxID=588596 RepID=UPI000CA71FDA|nr:hypothetical protein OCT59_025712 [Rhizophagus irregularis]GET51411.1 hypothetical protein RIR_jg34003.t2 [Rhizophagus irregularis DAOM 181602=DAOM 197198]